MEMISSRETSQDAYSLSSNFLRGKSFRCPIIIVINQFVTKANKIYSFVGFIIH